MTQAPVSQVHFLSSRPAAGPPPARPTFSFYRSINLYFQSIDDEDSGNDNTSTDDLESGIQLDPEINSDLTPNDPEQDYDTDFVLYTDIEPTESPESEFNPFARDYEYGPEVSAPYGFTFEPGFTFPPEFTEQYTDGTYTDFTFPPEFTGQPYSDGFTFPPDFTFDPSTDYPWTTPNPYDFTTDQYISELPPGKDFLPVIIATCGTTGSPKYPKLGFLAIDRQACVKAYIGASHWTEIFAPMQLNPKKLSNVEFPYNRV